MTCSHFVCCSKGTLLMKAPVCGGVGGCVVLLSLPDVVIC